MLVTSFVQRYILVFTSVISFVLRIFFSSSSWFISFPFRSHPRSFQDVDPHGRPDGWTEGGWRDARDETHGVRGRNFLPLLYMMIVWAPCIMHRCVIYPPPRSFPFSTSVLYPVDPPPPPPPVFPIFHSGSLPRPESGEVTFFLSFNYCPSGDRGRNFLPLL
jgi:hypothetical protein